MTRPHVGPHLGILATGRDYGIEVAILPASAARRLDTDPVFASLAVDLAKIAVSWPEVESISLRITRREK